MHAITPCLWFNGTAVDAAKFYTSVFPDSRIDNVSRAAADNPSTREGEPILVEFTIFDQPFQALNGGPDFKFNEAVSFVVDCKDQAEVDHYWERLVENGGEHSVCGWLKDRFGVSWQITPRRLQELIDSPDRDGARRAMEAMLKMEKLDIAKLEAAYRGEPVHA